MVNTVIESIFDVLRIIIQNTELKLRIVTLFRTVAKLPILNLHLARSLFPGHVVS